MSDEFVNHEALKRATIRELDSIIRDGGPAALIDATAAERRRREAPDPEPQRSIEKLREIGAIYDDPVDEAELEIGGAFDGFTVTSDADPGL